MIKSNKDSDHSYIFSVNRQDSSSYSLRYWRSINRVYTTESTIIRYEDNRFEKYLPKHNQAFR